MQTDKTAYGTRGVCAWRDGGGEGDREAAMQNFDRVSCPGPPARPARPGPPGQSRRVAGSSHPTSPSNVGRWLCVTSVSQGQHLTHPRSRSDSVQQARMGWSLEMLSAGIQDETGPGSAVKTKHHVRRVLHACFQTSSGSRRWHARLPHAQACTYHKQDAGASGYGGLVTPPRLRRTSWGFSEALGNGVWSPVVLPTRL